MLCRRLSLLLCLALAIFPFAVADAAPPRPKKNNVGKPQRTWFKTEPDFHLFAPRIAVRTENSSLLAPGYIFISNDEGPQIHDQDGTLVWHKPQKKWLLDQDFHPCDYLGERHTHLCWHVTVRKGHLNVAYSKNLVYDSSYTQVGRNYTRGLEGVTPNMHAFHMLPGGRSFLQPVYVPRRRDLRVHDGDEKGFIWDGCFQEIAVKGGKPLFKWCALEHYPPWEATIFFPGNSENTTSSKAGRGTERFPFDFFHLNAIDKNDEGDYFLSARHFDQILKIAGPNAKQVHGVEPGTALWRLGGKKGDIEMQGFNFSKQHAIRHISTSASETVISLFDNASEGSNAPSHNCSAGRIIKVNNATMRAEQLHEYPHPHGSISGSQGDMLVLPNGNVFVGWGKLPQVSEYARDGTLLFHARFHSNSYRAFKSPWRGSPVWAPKLVAYQHTCGPNSPLVAYVSWNGATEVRRWRFSIATRLEGPWIPVGTWDKHGFETRARLMNPRWLSPFMPYVTAEALDAHGRPLGHVVAKTWVPAMPRLKVKCDELGCAHQGKFSYKPSLSRARTCRISRDRPTYLALVVLVLFVESIVYFAHTLALWTVDKWAARRRRKRTTAAYEAVRQSTASDDLGRD